MTPGSQDLHLSLLYCSSMQYLANPMQVKLTRLRSCGKALSSAELSLAPAIEGELSTSRYNAPLRSYTVAKVSKQRLGGKVDTLALLYEPKVTQIQGDVLFIDGIEKLITGETVFQQWRCELL